MIFEGKYLKKQLSKLSKFDEPTDPRNSMSLK